MMRGRNAWTSAAAVVVLALLFILAVAVVEIRLTFMAAFCILMPGYGWAHRMQLKDRGDTLAMTVVLSLCASVLVGTALAVSGLWSPLAGFAILVLITLGGFAPIPGVAPFRKEFKSLLLQRPGQRKYPRG
jgi:sterol desaturase/sphingolipid hydroxylase (fatty acid hydroxylase superfamily)